MRNHLTWSLAAALAFAVAAPVSAQQAPNGANGEAEDPTAITEVAEEKAEETEDSAASAFLATAPAITMQYFRPQDQRGINVFETPKEAGAPYTGFRLDWGAAFTQQFQGLSQSHTATPVLDADGNQTNALRDIGWGFNNAAANLFLNAQVAPGIRVSLTTYLSSRHHPEAWVKDGYFLIDESPFNVALFDNLMEYLTVKVGHFEINYGDAHFRRTDGGNAMHNPFTENYIMDAFTTEIGAEVLFRTPGGLLAMGSVTGGEIRGQVQGADRRKPSFIGKVGFDRQMTDMLRTRLTGSVYHTAGSMSNTLYGGDRAGARYVDIMEGSNFAGRWNPGFRNSVTAFQVNPFVKLGGLEFFGVAETASGQAANETEDRTWTQYAGDLVYRFLPQEQLYVGARYNTTSGELQGSRADASIDRWNVGAGWFLTPNILLKGDFVRQQYNGFAPTDVRHGGQFSGFMVEGVVAF
jgi:hypothetical protein